MATTGPLSPNRGSRPESELDVENVITRNLYDRFFAMLTTQRQQDG